MSTAVIVIGGAPPPPELRRVVPSDAFVIAADSGYDHARTLGLAVDLLVGDLDSISSAGLEHATATRVVIERHPPEKDATDTELALDRAVHRGASTIVVLGGGGDRVDHLLATLFLVASPTYAAHRVVYWWATSRIDVVHGPTSLEVIPGTDGIFSLLPIHGPANGVDIDGAAFPLDRADLAAGTSIGISNVATGPAVVRLTRGTLLVISTSALEDSP